VWTVAFIIDSVFISQRRADLVLWKTVVQAILKVALLVPLAFLFGAPGIVVAANGSMIAGIAVVLIVARRATALRVQYPDYQGLRSSWASAGANYAVSLVLAMPLAIGSLIILNREGPSAAGSFYLLWMFGTMAMMAPAAFSMTSLVEMSQSNRPNVRLLRPFLISTAIAGVVLVAGLILLPTLGMHYRYRGFFELLPFSLAALPGFYLNIRIAAMRTSGDHVRLVAAPLLCVASFVLALSLAPLGFEASGWLWLGSVIIGALAAFDRQWQRSP
jgi:hypothetical protein